MSGGFQTAVNSQPAPAVEGDFASMNPYFTVDFGPGGAVAGPSGAFVGRAAWAAFPADGDGVAASISSFGTGPITGILHREQQALITLFLAGSSMLVPKGFGISLLNGGDLWVKNNGSGQALPGMKAYANFADGKFTFAATASPTGGASGSASTVTPETSSFTGSIAGNILTVVASGITGTIYPGTTISGTNVAAGTVIGAQISGAAGGAGTYYVSIPEQTVASTTISGTYGLLTVGGTVVSGFAVNQVISGTNVVTGTTITQAVSGLGGAGTYVVNNNANVTTTAISVAAVNVETKFICMSPGLAGELVKISDHANG